MEWPGRRLAGQAGTEHLGRVLALLDGRLRRPRHVCKRDHVADREHLGMAGNRQVRVHVQPSRAVDLCAARVTEQRRQR